MKKLLIRKIVSAVLIFVMVLSFMEMGISNSIKVYGDTTTEDLNSAQEKKTDINAQIQNVQNEIAQLQQQSSDTKAYIAQLDGKMNELDTSLNRLNNEITAKQEEITNAEEGLAQAQIVSQEQYESMKLRIQFMYEYNTENYIEILLSSTNMGDMLNKVEYITKISQYDRDMLKKYQEMVDYIANTKVQLENDYQQLDGMIASLEVEKASLAVVQEAKNAELLALNNQTNQAKEKESSLHADLAAQENEIKAMEAQIAAQEAAAKKAQEEAASRAAAEAASKAQQAALADTPSTTPSNNQTSTTPAVSSGTGFVWPTVSRRITSNYGDTEDRSAPHQGIDIGAVSPGVSGDPIYAADSGTVTVATYSSSAGNWIWIYHGNGLYTVYMHCSSLAVSVNQTVTKGQVIGYMGSTGNSTGAHLHFGVRLNGSYVNPWNYVG